MQHEQAQQIGERSTTRRARALPLRSVSAFRDVFRGGGPPGITPASFARLLAADTARLPSPRAFTARDGLKLAYRHYPSAAASITIVLHGAAGHSAHMHALASTIANRGASQVYCLDLRGHGLSGARPGFAVTYSDQMVDDVSDFVARIQASTPTAPMVLLGYSAGGGLAIRVARELAPGQLRALVLLAPYLGLDSPTARPGLGGWARPNIGAIALLAALNWLGIRMFNDSHVVNFAQPESTRDGQQALQWSFNTMMAFGPNDWRRELAAIERSRPVLLLAAENDECFLSENYPVVVERWVSHATIKIMRSCGHWDLLVDRVTADEVAGWIPTHV